MVREAHGCRGVGRGRAFAGAVADVAHAEFVAGAGEVRVADAMAQGEGSPHDGASGFGGVGVHGGLHFTAGGWKSGMGVT